MKTFDSVDENDNDDDMCGVFNDAQHRRHIRLYMKTFDTSDENDNDDDKCDVFNDTQHKQLVALLESIMYCGAREHQASNCHAISITTRISHRCNTKRNIIGPILYKVAQRTKLQAQNWKYYRQTEGYQKKDTSAKRGHTIRT